MEVVHLQSHIPLAIELPGELIDLLQDFSFTFRQDRLKVAQLGSMVGCCLIHPLLGGSKHCTALSPLCLRDLLGVAVFLNLVEGGAKFLLVQDPAAIACL